MEANVELSMVPKPNLNPDNLPYLNGKSSDIYVNLFKINLKKNLDIFQYPYVIDPELDNTNMEIRDKLFKIAAKKIKRIYGEFFQSGDMIYATKEIKELNEFVAKIYKRDGPIEYNIKIQPCSNSRSLKNENIENDEFAKQIIEILVREILSANPNLDLYRNLFVNKNYKKQISTDRVSIDFYPGFTTSFVYTSKGPFLNVTLKNKILSTDTVLEYLRQNNYNQKNNQKKIKELLIGRTFKVGYAKRNYRINDISFDKSPRNTKINRDGRSINLIEYYKEAHDITIKVADQPLIVVKNEDQEIYFIPELCYLGGLDDKAVKDGKFMRELANYTKFKPNERVNKTNQFLDLFNNNEHRILEKTKDNKVEKIEQPSSKEKAEFYGIEILPAESNFKAYYMYLPSLKAGGEQKIKINERIFNVYNKIPMKNWLCLYEKHNYNDADILFKTLVKASKGYGLNISEPEWVEMPDRSNHPDDWTGTVEDYMKNNNYQFVLFLLDRNDFIYPELKKHSLVTSGYISQVVKTNSLRKNGMSVCSKILLQLNAKLDGASYRIDFDDSVKKRNLMVIGVDSSHFGHNTGVAMVATIDSNFTKFYNSEEVIKEENKTQLEFKVSVFIEKALTEFFKDNKKLPSGIIIYRQGVSLQQKEYLKNEVNAIDQRLKGKADQSILLKEKLQIPYYYILVNTKTTYKFFEKKQKNFDNPSAGLLVFDGVTNPHFYEFYIQPQEVTGGSATPTCFHVAYGNMNSPEFIPKFTFDLCHTYANWQGPVRIPNVIKAAEKLSKMTSKYTKGSLNKDLIKGQAYL
jgi:aubergine-like protein